MVAASRLRRAQERIQQARPFATQMLRVLNSLATRVDPGSHPLLDERLGEARGRQGAALRDHSRPRFVRQLQYERDQGGRQLHHRGHRTSGRAGPDRPARSGLLRPPGFRGAVRAGQSVPGAAVRSRPRHRRRPRSRSSSKGASTACISSTTSSSRCIQQRIVVERLLPIPRLDIEGPAPGATQGPTVDYLYEPTPRRAVHHAAAATRRGADVPSAARIERRILRRADDRDGRRHAQFGRHAGASDAVHEQGQTGGDYARDHRGRVRRASAASRMFRGQRITNMAQRQQRKESARSCR